MGQAQQLHLPAALLGSAVVAVAHAAPTADIGSIVCQHDNKVSFADMLSCAMHPPAGYALIVSAATAAHCRHGRGNGRCRPWCDMTAPAAGLQNRLSVGGGGGASCGTGCGVVLRRRPRLVASPGL